MRSMIRVATDALRNVRSPLNYAGSRFSIISPPSSGMTRALKSTATVGTLFSIVNRTSTSVSKVPWDLWRTHPSGDKKKRTKVVRHLALDVWNRPNPFMVQSMFVETQQQHMDLTGEAWWVVDRNPLARSLVLGLWPVRPDRMAPVPDPEKYISHYEYTMPDGQRMRLELDEVIFLKMPNPDDPYRGLGPVQSILTDLDASRYSAEWNRMFFLNGAEPGGIIESPDTLNDTQLKTFVKRWDEQHRGVSNAHRVAILEGMKWVDRKYTQRDMQFAELRKISSDVIREAFGIPKFALGDVDDVNRATADASAAWFNESLTVPRLDRMKDALNYQYLPMFTGVEGMEFDYESPVNEDYERENTTLKAASEAWALLVTTGVDPKDASRVCGLPEDMKYEKPEPPAPPEPPPGTDPNDPNNPAPVPGQGGSPANRGRVVRPKVRAAT